MGAHPSEADEANPVQGSGPREANPAQVMKRLMILAVALATVLATLPAAASQTAAELAEMFRAYGNSAAGWTGGDGAYSVPLPDGRIAWLFSDTFLGPVNSDGSRPSSAKFINNSIVVQDGTSLTTRWDDSHSVALAAIQPSPPGGYYWLGDGTVEDGTLKVFVYRFVSAPVPFGFQQVATDLATLSLSDFTVLDIEHLPYGFIPAVGSGPVTYGNAVLEEGGFVYVYGVEDLHVEKYLHVARAVAGEVAGPWEFWTGSEWSDNPLLSARLAGGISNELSIHRVGERYLLVAQAGSQVVTATSVLPQGPWSTPEAVYRTPEATGSTFTYNAKAHPEFSDEDTLLVTYNVNTTDGAALYADISIYRPRFVELAVP